MLFGQTIFYGPYISLGPKFFWPILGLYISFQPKIFSGPLNFFGTQNLFGSNIFWANNFLDQFLYPELFQTQNFVWNLNYKSILEYGLLWWIWNYFTKPWSTIIWKQTLDGRRTTFNSRELSHYRRTLIVFCCVGYF